jgi:hypothetical protein
VAKVSGLSHGKMDVLKFELGLLEQGATGDCRAKHGDHDLFLRILRLA